MYKQSSELINDIKAGNQAALDYLYKKYRSNFLQWIKQNYHCSHDDALDVFQDSIIIIYGHIKSGKLTNLKSDFKTYLFAVGKYTLLDKLKKNKIKTNHIDEYPHLKIDKVEELNERQQLISDLLGKLREPCKTIIYLFYYKSYGLADIAITMEYSSKDVVKAQKVRCMKNFRKIVVKNLEKNKANS